MNRHHELTMKNYALSVVFALLRCEATAKPRESSFRESA